METTRPFRRLLCWVVALAAAVSLGSAETLARDPSARAPSDPTADKQGIGHLDEPRARELAAGQERSAKVVGAEERWQSSGVFVREGQLYRIDAKGEWQAGGFCNRSGPDGKNVHTLLCFPSPLNMPIVKGFSFQTLIAKIGQDGTPFAVGDTLELEAPREGTLYFRMNDGPGWAWDNSGQVTASIKLVQGGAVAAPAPAPAPEPAPAPAPVVVAPVVAAVPPAPIHKTITFPEAALFDVNKAELKPQGKEKIKEYREEAREQLSAATAIKIIGHTDSTGTPEYNKQLSLKRAEAVRDYLIELGADASKMEVAGMGEEQPIADNKTRDGRTQNRRVEVDVIGIAK